MARAPRAIQLKDVVKLERSAHVLARVRDELLALPPSSRATRLLERNEQESARVAEKLGTLRNGTPPTPPAARVK